MFITFAERMTPERVKMEAQFQASLKDGNHKAAIFYHGKCIRIAEQIAVSQIERDYTGDTRADSGGLIPLLAGVVIGVIFTIGLSGLLALLV
jgi:hypothetical protein